MLLETGIPTKEDLLTVTPPQERFNKGPVVIVECFQEIPCNPCVDACKLKAIAKPKDINDLPIVDFGKCNGCGACIAQCPGLAIFVVDKTWSESHAVVRQINRDLLALAITFNRNERSIPRNAISIPFRNNVIIIVLNIKQLIL